MEIEMTTLLVFICYLNTLATNLEISVAEAEMGLKQSSFSPDSSV